MVHVSEVYGVGPQELYDEWRDYVANGGEESLSTWLRESYASIDVVNPDGGWDAENAPDFDNLAARIENVVGA